MQNTITLAQAAEFVEENLRRVLAVLPDTARAERILAESDPCDDPADHGPLGREMATVQYQIDGLSPDRYAEYFDLLHAWWTDHGFRTLHDDRPKLLYLWVENNVDGFRMAAQANDLGELYLISTSPCVWPNGVPTP